MVQGEQNYKVHNVGLASGSSDFCLPENLTFPVLINTSCNCAVLKQWTNLIAQYFSEVYYPGENA